MTDPADRHLDEQRLEGRLHALARGVQVPVVPTDHDVRRGRRRLLHMRLAVAGATTGTLAVVLGLTSLTAGDPAATEPPVVTQPPSATTPAVDSSPSADDGGSGNEQAVGDPGSFGGRPSASGAHTEGDAGDDAGSKTGRVPEGSTPTGEGTADTGAHGGTTMGSGHPEPSHGPTTSVPSSDPTQPTSGTPTTPTASPTTPTGTPTATPTVPPTDTGKVRVHQALLNYNDVLAEYLDPQRDHLQPYDRLVDTKQTTRLDGVLFALGTTYRWEGLRTGGLGITVASGWDQVEWACGASYADWACRSADVTEPALAAEVASHDGVRQVAVEHADGQVVVLTTDSPIGSSDELVAAAADDRLVLPGIAPASPPLINSGAFAEAGLAALVRQGESFDQTSIDRSPEVSGTWTVDNGAADDLTWSARPTYSGAGWQCLTTYWNCREVEVDALGTTVHVAGVRQKAGGGLVVQYDGPAYAVRVYVSDRAYPKKRAFAFLTDPDWQPVR